MDTYEEGYSDGYAEGFDKGAEEGFKEGLSEGDASGFFNWVAFGIVSGAFLAHSGFSAGSILLVGALSLAAVVAPLVMIPLRVDSYMETLNKLNREHGIGL